MEIDRRDFLKRAGLGSIALGTLPTLISSLTTPAWAQGGTNFTFLAVSRAGPAGTPAQPAHTLIMGGQGHFDPSKVASPVEGGGVYTHFTAPGTPPLPIVSSGTWKARLLASYKQIGTYGVFGAGILEMVVDIFAQIPSSTVIRGARLKLVCNVGPAGLSNPGEEEGFTLSILGTDFFTGGNPGPFVPMTPNVGVTVFSTASIPQ